MSPVNEFDIYTPKSAAENRRRLASDSLAKLVQARWREGVAEKSPISTAIMECQRAMEGKPISGVHIDVDLPIVLNITASICEGLHAILVDAVNLSAENLFTLKPTPEAELPPEVSDRLAETLQQAQEAVSAVGGALQLEDITDMAAGIARAAKEEMQLRATRSAADMQDRIRDRLLEGGFRAALSEALWDYCTSMAMVVKSPSTKVKMVRSWRDGRMTYKAKLVRAVERIDPECFYMARGAVSPQTAEWCLERRRVQPSELLGLASAPGYDPNEIALVLKTHPNGWVEMENGTASFSVDGGEAYTRSYAYDALVMTGKVKGQVLQDMGLVVGDPSNVYEAEVCAIAGFVIYAAINVDESGRRPYHMASFYRNATTPWGGSPASRLRDLQRVITSLFIAMGGDAAMSGVHIELNPTQLHKDDPAHSARPPRAPRPREVRLVANRTAENKRAYDIFRVETQVAAFQAELERLHALAYEITGLPRMAMGQTTGAGTLGRTSGGVASMLNQATKGTRRAIQDIEQYLIEPVAQGFVDWELRFNPPPGFQGDINVQARGLTGLVEQAAEIDDLQWAMQTLGSISGQVGADGQPLVPPDALRFLVYRMFKIKGLPTDKRIFPVDYDRVADTGGQVTPPTPMTAVAGFSAIDPGRSPAAAQAIAASNDPMGVAQQPM